MQNRERDQMSRNNQPTSAGDLNRKTSPQIGKGKSDSSADFGQNKGRSDNLNEPNSRGSKSGGYDSSSKRDRDLDSSIKSGSSGNSGVVLPGTKDHVGGSRH
jgi:hypothetical protein